MTPSHRSPTLVTAAIIRDGPRLLIAKRKPDAKIEAGKWEFPGGKVDYGEHPEAGLIREIKEELNLDIAVDRFFAHVSHVYNHRDGPMHIVLLCYLCHMTGGKLECLDVAEAKWITLDELSDYEFAVADHPFVTKLKQEGVLP